jgi:hypothetical protein
LNCMYPPVSGYSVSPLLHGLGALPVDHALRNRVLVFGRSSCFSSEFAEIREHSGRRIIGSAIMSGGGDSAFVRAARTAVSYVNTRVSILKDLLAPRAALGFPRAPIKSGGHAVIPPDL